MTHESLLKMLHRKAESSGSWAKLAISIGVSPQYLNDVKSGKRAPGRKMLDGLGLSLVAEYRKGDAK